MKCFNVKVTLAVTWPLLPSTVQGRLRLEPRLTVTSPGWEEKDWPELTEWRSSQRRNMAGLTTYIQPSHWSSSYNAALSLVESSRLLKYFHALKGCPKCCYASSLMP